MEENTQVLNEIEETKEEKKEIVETIEQESKIEVEKTEEKEEKSEFKIKGEARMEKKSKKGFLIGLIIAVILLLAVLSTVFALVNINNTNILKGIKIKGIEIENLSKQSAIEKVTKIIEEELKNSVNLKYGDYETTISPEQIEFKYNIEDAVNEAYNFGRNNNILINNYNILYSMILGKDIDIKYEYNKETLEKTLKEIESKLPNAMKDNSYYIEGNKLIITKGKSGIVIEKEKIIEQIINKIENNKKEYIEIPTIEKQPDLIDIDKIYEEVYTEPKDASYKKDPFEIIPHVNGIDFDKEKAKEIIKEDKNEYEIDLKVTVPSVTTDKIGTEAFPDLLASFSTKYDASNYNRSTNLVLASNKINGKVLMPGEEFSYNKVVGERTISAGYKEAAIYAGGKVVDGLGGGICQISSTLYNAVVYANLEITERSNHSFVTSYVPAGKDATVVYGYIDFRFKNTREYPIKLVSTVKNGVAKISIYGIKQEKEYDIEIESHILQSIPYTTVYEEDSNMESGKEVVIQKGALGYKSITYKILKLNGSVVSKTVLSRDTYSAMQRIVKRGTKQVNDDTTNKPVTTKPIEGTENKPETNIPDENKPEINKPETNENNIPTNNTVVDKPNNTENNIPSSGNNVLDTTAN